MKKHLKISIIISVMTTIGFTVNSQNTFKNIKPEQTDVRELRDSESVSSQYLKGEITVKLKKDVGDFGKQSGNVRFNIQSLDEKVVEFEVYQLEKRFHYNPAKLRSDLPDLSRIYKLSFPDKFSLNQVVESFSSDPNVEYAEAIPVYHSTAVPDDNLYDQLQYLPQIFAEEAWDVHKGEDGAEEIIIAVVDIGVDWDHEDLIGNIWQNLAEDADNDGHTIEYDIDEAKWVLDPGDINDIDEDENGYIDDLIGWNFWGNTNNPTSTGINSHGTRVAGVSNAVTNNGLGIASISWNLSLMPVRFHTSNPYEGIIYAAENGADVINNSWTGSYSAAGQDAVNYAAGLGSIIVASAGNAHSATDDHYPSYYQNVIGVASVNVNDVKVDLSNFNIAVDISAPGGDFLGQILTTGLNDEYVLSSGTSFASPLVAGCLGLLKSYHPDWTNDQLITQLLGTADNIDGINPNHVGLLGSGRVNAYRLLTEENVMPFVKLGLISTNIGDENGNDIIEPGEMVTLDFDLHNYAPCCGSENVSVTLTTENPDITIINGTSSLNIPGDTSFSLPDQMQVQIGINAGSQIAELTLHFESDVPITVGQDMKVILLINPSGVLVYEDLNGSDYSGIFIRDYLQENNYPVTYSNYLPDSITGFSAVFLSFGNFTSGYTVLNDKKSNSIMNYLENGGFVYLEGGDCFGWDQSNNGPLQSLFGLESVEDGQSNPISSLQGQDDALTNGIVFTGNNQASNNWIDEFVPSSNGIIAFDESNYGTVAVQNSVQDGHRTFIFSYALSKLSDGETLNTRNELLQRIINFFDIQVSVPTIEESIALNSRVYPNPMNTNATIQYYLLEDNHVILDIFNSTGQKVMQPINENQFQGEHNFNWDVNELPAGIYYYTLKNETQIHTGKIVIIK